MSHARIRDSITPPRADPVRARHRERRIAPYEVVHLQQTAAPTELIGAAAPRSIQRGVEWRIWEWCTRDAGK